MLSQTWCQPEQCHAEPVEALSKTHHLIANISTGSI